VSSGAGMVELCREVRQEGGKIATAMICRFGGCCKKGMMCLFWHSSAQRQIFKDELALKQRKLAEPCGFCARGECRFGASCRRAKRVMEVSTVESESVAPTDLGRGTTESMGDKERDVATVSGGNGSGEAADSDGDFGFRLVGAAAEGIFRFGARRKVGVARRPSAMVDAGGVGGAGAFGALASAEEEVAEEEEVDITFLPPKPRVKGRKEKTKEKAAVKAAADAAEEAAEGDSGAAKTAAVAAVATDGKLEDLEVLSIGSDPIDKTSEEAADKEQIADAAGGARQCPLVAAVVAAEAAKAAKAEEAAAVARQKTAAVVTDSKIRQTQQKTVRLLSIKQRVRNGEKTVETDEERMERFKEGLEQSLW
jgi:hypothetical protein